MGAQIYQAKYAIGKIRANQNGNCVFCETTILETEKVVSRKGSAVSKYYHERCAKRLHII